MPRSAGGLGFRSAESDRAAHDAWTRCAAALRSPPCWRPNRRAVEVKSMSRTWDDDELLARLAEAQRATERVPRDFVEAGKAAFAWRNIDAELAELVYGPAREEASLAGRARAEEAHLCALTFTSTTLTIEIEVTGEALLGRVVPLQAGEVEVTTQAG